MTGSSGDEAARVLATFLDGMPTPKERLNAAIRALLDERGRRHTGTNLGAGSSQMGPGDEVAGRVLAFVDAWRAVRQSGDSLIKMCVTNDGPVYLDENDVRALLDERGQLLGKRDIATQTDRLTIEGLSALHQRAAAERDEATARAEQAEAKVERLKDVALHVIDTEKQLLRERIADELNRAAALGYPHNAAWNQDLHQAAHIARDGLEAWFADEGRGPDGKRLDGRRQPWEPIRDQQDVDDLAAAEEGWLSPEEDDHA